ncbi:MAG: DUF4363 family protein [Oscillospiraceae bacterium]|nr:DUF4363 family protein [Oscillospiraceae bacterium]
MKFLYWGVGILALCLVLCLVTTSVLSQDAETAATILEKARGAAEAGDFDAAARLTAQAKEFWESRRGFFGMVLRHAEADQVNSAFRALLAYAENRCTEEFEPTCAELIEQIRHLSEMEAPHYYNILCSGPPL